MNDRQIYSLSGAIGSGPFIAPIAGILAGALGAFIYAYVDIYSPIVGIVSILFVLGLGYGVGVVIGKAGKAAHCRNAWALHAVGFAVGVVTLYLSWVCFEWVLMRKAGEELGIVALFNLLLSPGSVWEIAKSIAETGWYSVKSADVKGIGSWITWGGEAVMIVGLITLAAGTEVADAVYCEHARRWVPKGDGSLRLRLPDDREALLRLTEGRVEDLEALDRAGDDEFPRFHLELWRSDATPRTAAYKLKLEVPKVEDGKVTIESKDFSPQFAASQEEIARLAALADRPVTPLPAEEVAESAG